MFRAAHLLIIMAVLWCGLHLSSAEADVPWSLTSTHVALHDENARDLSDHGMPHISQACHNHCPMAPDDASGPALAAPALDELPPTAAVAKKLYSLSQAPPVQPPAA